MSWFIGALKKYVDFNGRARRKEYWMFILVCVIITIILSIIEVILLISSGLQPGILTNLFALAILLPGISVGIRRMHDNGKSGWFILIPVYNLILAATEGEKGNNQYGPDPKEAV